MRRSRAGPPRILADANLTFSGFAAFTVPPRPSPAIAPSGHASFTRRGYDQPLTYSVNDWVVPPIETFNSPMGGCRQPRRTGDQPRGEPFGLARPECGALLLLPRFHISSKAIEDRLPSMALLLDGMAGFGVE